MTAEMCRIGDRVRRCRACRKPASDASGRATGDLCPTCKQTHRDDRKWMSFAVNRAKRMLAEEGAIDVDRLTKIIRRKYPDVRALPAYVPPPGKTPPSIYTALIDSGLLGDAQARALRLRVRAAREGWIDE